MSKLLGPNLTTTHHTHAPPQLSHRNSDGFMRSKSFSTTPLSVIYNLPHKSVIKHAVDTSSRPMVKTDSAAMPSKEKPVTLALRSTANAATSSGHSHPGKTGISKKISSIAKDLLQFIKEEKHHIEEEIIGRTKTRQETGILRPKVAAPVLTAKKSILEAAPTQRPPSQLISYKTAPKMSTVETSSTSHLVSARIPVLTRKYSILPAQTISESRPIQPGNAEPRENALRRSAFQPTRTLTLNVLPKSKPTMTAHPTAPSNSHLPTKSINVLPVQRANPAPVPLPVTAPSAPMIVQPKKYSHLPAKTLVESSPFVAPVSRMVTSSNLPARANQRSFLTTQSIMETSMSKPHSEMRNLNPSSKNSALSSELLIDQLVSSIANKRIQAKQAKLSTQLRQSVKLESTPLPPEQARVMRDFNLDLHLHRQC